MTGALREPITFQRQTSRDEDFDETIGPWNESFRAWARIVPRNSSDQQTDEVNERITTHDVRIRYDSRFAGDMRILWGSDRYLQINGSTNVDERNRWIDIECSEVERFDI